MDILERLGREKKIVLFGQEDYLARVNSYLEKLFPGLEKICLSFTLEEDQPDSTRFNFSMHETTMKEFGKYLVIVTFSNKFAKEAVLYLKRQGFYNILSYDAAMDNRLKVDFFKLVYAEQGKPFVLLADMPAEHESRHCSLTVYMARCVVDKLLSKEPVLPKCVVPIQVGAALTDKRIAELTDDTGDNISERNRRYSETTALYWMWKNAKSDWLGLCHYRRLFVDIEEIADKLQQVDIDALLPLPTLCEHSVFEDYLLKHIPTVWRPMMDVLRELSPEYYEVAEQIFKGLVFYASNMFILRREVLDDLCQWMFPVVMEVERRVGELRDTYYNRYAGFVTERLITLYFIHNKRGWRIAHVEKVFIG